MNMMLSIQQDLAEAQRCVEEMAELRKNQALAEKEYRVAKAKKVLELRADGYPVSVVADLAKGDEHVAELAFKRDCAEGLVDANREQELLCKKRVDTFREQLEREWSESGWRS